jgi:type I restriction enzyme S subunit
VSARELITEHLSLWTGAVTQKSTRGRGSNGKVELTGIKKLRELILELAVRGKLVTQAQDDEPLNQLFKKIESEKSAQLKAKTIRKPKTLPEVQETERPFPIPDSWRYCRLNEIGTWGSGATPKRSNARYYGGGIPWFKSGELYKDFIDSSEETITDVAVQETSVRMNQPGDVLIAMYGATIGKAAILEVAGTTNQAVCACTPWSGISNRFLLLLLKAYRSRFIAMGAGGAQPNISREKIIATVIGLPPEQEQHRIVQKVDELMALCDRLEQQTGDQLEAHETLVDNLLSTLTQSQNATELADNWARLAAHFDTLFTTEQSIDKLKQTILQLAVMGRLVEQDVGDEPTYILFKRIASERALNDTKYKSLPLASSEEQPFTTPTSWEWVHLGAIAKLQGGFAYKSQTFKTEGAHQVIRMGNIRPGILNLNVRPVFIEPDLAHSTVDFQISTRSILMTMTGTKGKKDYLYSVLVDEHHSGRNKLYLNQRLCMIHSEHVLPEFLQLLFTDNRCKEAIFKQATGTANQANIGMAALERWLLPIPPKPEQHRIVQKVDELMALCDQLKERLNQANQTRSQLAGAVVTGALN